MALISQLTFGNASTPMPSNAPCVDVHASTTCPAGWTNLTRWSTRVAQMSAGTSAITVASVIAKDSGDTDGFVKPEKPDKPKLGRPRLYSDAERKERRVIHNRKYWAKNGARIRGRAFLNSN